MVNGPWAMVNGPLNFELRYYFRSLSSRVLFTIHHSPLTTNQLKKTFMKILVTIIIITSMVIGCTKGGKLEGIRGDQYSITSMASSKQLVPVIDTTSTATFTGFYDEQSNVFTFTITWNDLWRTASTDTITSVNIYGPATATANGDLVRALSFVSTNNAASANLGLAGITGFTLTEKKDFLEEAYYFTINTKKFPNGIVRGQLAATKQ
jgi:hypothetical protein